jgi:hypothetical protein
MVQVAECLLGTMAVLCFAEGSAAAAKEIVNDVNRV